MPSSASLDLALAGRLRRRHRLDAERDLRLERRDLPRRLPQRSGDLRGIFVEHRHGAVEPARIDVERHRAARRVERTFHAAVQAERGVREIGDAHLVERQPLGIELERAADALHVDARNGRAADIHAERAGAGALKRRTVERRAAEGEHAIDIEFGGLQFRIEARRLAADRARIGEPAFDGLAVELEFQPLDRELLRADGEFAAGAQHAGLRLRAFAAAFEPGEKRARIARLDLRRPLEGHAFGRVRDASAEAHLRETRRAKLQRLDLPFVAVEPQVAAHRLQRAGRERHRVDADAELHRKRRTVRRRQRLDEGLQRRERQASGRFRQRQRAIEIELPRREHALEARVLAEAQFRRTGQTDRALVRAVLIFELFEQRLRGRGLHLRAGAPRHRDLAAPFRAPDGGGTRQCERAVEARRIVFQPQRALGLDRERMIGRVDAEPHLHGAVITEAARAGAIAVALAARDETALAFRRSEQRTHIALEPETLQRGLRAARAVRQAQAPVFDVDFFDLEAVGLEAELRPRQSSLPLAPMPSETSGPAMRNSEARTSPRMSEPSASSAWSSRARTCGCAAGPTSTCPSVIAGVGRMRRSIGTADAHRLPGELGRFGLEIRPVLFPVDKMRPDQRCNQRQYDRDSNPEQGCLQSVLRAPSVPRGTQALTAQPIQSLAELWRRIYVVYG